MASIPKRPQIFFRFIKYPVHDGTEYRERIMGFRIGQIVDWYRKDWWVKYFNEFGSVGEPNRECTKEELESCFELTDPLAHMFGALTYKGRANTKAACKHILTAPNKRIYNLNVGEDGSCLYLLYSNRDIYTDENGDVFFMCPTDSFGKIFVWDTRKEGVLSIRGMEEREYHDFLAKQEKIKQKLGI